MLFVIDAAHRRGTIVGEFDWLVKLLPEGASVTAVIAVVVLFLKYITSREAEYRESIKLLTESYNTNQVEERRTFSEEQKEARLTFGEQLTNVTRVFSEKHEAIQEKIVGLTESHIKVSTETIGALNGLKEAVRNLQEKVK